MFNHIEQGRRLKKEDQRPGNIPFVMSGITNQGVIGYISNPVASFPANSITVDIFGNSFYRSYAFGAGDDTGVYWSDTINYSKASMLFFTAAIERSLEGKYSYGHKLRSSQSFDFLISLPQTADGKIDFAFMEEFVRELEESRLRELEVYLLATGLNDYQLSEVDRSALRSFKNICWQEFRVGDLFDRISTVKLKYKAKELPQQPIDEYILPCLTSSFMNQGLNYYAPRKGATILNNVISIPSNSDVYRAYYQSRDFTVLSDAYAIQWIYDTNEITSRQYLFMVACINKVTDLPIYSYKNKLGGWNVVKDKYISLPATADGQPDLTVMEELVTAMQKIAITDVAKYTEQQLNVAHHSVETTNEAQMIDLHTHEYHYTELEPMMAAEPFECYKWEYFDKSICDFFDGDKTILIGCYKGKKYLDWIRSHSLYNIRLGRTKGSMEENRELFDSTSLLVLYELGKPNKLSAYKIVGNKEMGKEELLAMDYPNKKPRRSYMTFSITPLEMDLTFLVEHHLIERLIELNSENAKGAPVFIHP